MKKKLKDILQVVHDYIYYNKDHTDTLQLNFTDDDIELFNKHVSYAEVQQAIINGLKLKEELMVYDENNVEIEE